LIGLTPSLKDPCLYTGFITDPANTSASLTATPLLLGLCVNKFVYFSEDSAVKALFCHLLAEQCKVDFMGIVELFLGVHFSWRITPTTVSVHLNNSGFATNLVKSYSCQTRDKTPTDTPYQLSIPSDSIAPSVNAMTLLPSFGTRKLIRASLSV
jgi:hypothetical protein